MEEIFEEVKRIARTADEAARKNMMVQLRAMTYSLEDVDDTVNRISHLPLQLSAVRVGIDLKLFKLLAARDSPYSVDEIAKVTGASPQLLGRLLRFLASIATIEETGKDSFTASHVTKNLAVPGSNGGICHGFDTSGPLFQELPAFLRRTKHQNPTDPEHTVFQDAYKFEGSAFEWFGQHPENLGYFQEMMSARRTSIAETWLSVYPVESEAQGLDPKATLLIDIGGSIGHICAQFKQVFPHIPGRVILQELAETIAVALPTPGVENMVHDFLTPQPIKDAKYYYLAHVLHDWPDVLCRQILRHTKAAMGKDSAILVDEMVLPDTNAHSNVLTFDFEMMCATAGGERTESQWDELFASEGLKRVQTWCYKPTTYESVMKVLLA